MKIGDKIVLFTDIHLGLRNNERRHNEECLEFIKWTIAEGLEFGAKTSIFAGDWHNQRNSIQSSTLSYSNQAFELLNNAFEKHYAIVGNHDLFYKDKRDIHSIEFARNLKNIHIINDITVIGDMVLSPWLVSDEYKKISSFHQPYIIGHFELPFFLMNAQVAMPDTGHISRDDFKGRNQTVFSGHFHKRQIQKNIHGNDIIYAGNCFPHNFSDVNDDERGIVLLELGKPPIFKKWHKAPEYRNFLLSNLISSPELLISEKTIAKVTIDLPITFEEANFIKETLHKDYNVRELRMLPLKAQIDSFLDIEVTKFNSVDEIVNNCIKSIESNTLDTGLLMEIYNQI